jgi:hypothetical protein
MAKWKAPDDFKGARASRAERAAMTRMEVTRNTCPWCETTYQTYRDSQRCETWHKVCFRKIRADLAAAIKKAQTDRDESMVKRLTRERDKYPADL